jgi:Signal transduction histidine kinase regulating C4-dicarboxylate transport system
MAFSSLITVLVLSGLISLLTFHASKVIATQQSEKIALDLKRKVETGEADIYLHINCIEELNQENKYANNFFNSLTYNSAIGMVNFDKLPSGLTQLWGKDKIFVEINIKNKEQYSSFKYDETTHLYRDTLSKQMINDVFHNQIGYIKVQVNPMLIAPFVFGFVAAVVLLSILALIIAKFCTMILTYPIINPIRQLETKIKALAQGDNDTALHTQIKLKRPLREIESLANSTNLIMSKLHNYTEALQQQKEELESQNNELEVQNDELEKSKRRIEEQQGQLIQTEKMASVGLLTAAITHEINTPIGAINSNAQISEMLLNSLIENPSHQSGEELKNTLEQLKEVNDVNLMACSRIQEIIKSLKSYSRLDQSELQYADINEGIKSVLVLTNNLLKRRITVHENYGELPMISCFPGQLNQVFMNIVVNATQAIEGEGELFISTILQEEYIVITFRDTGTGIKPENINKIFDPDFSTKGVGVGLGLGLYISYNIIQNHNGEILVESELGKWTQFTIKIPVSSSELENEI